MSSHSHPLTAIDIAAETRMLHNSGAVPIFVAGRHKNGTVPFLQYHEHRIRYRPMILVRVRDRQELVILGKGRDFG